MDADGPLPETDEGLAHLAKLDGLSSLDLSMLQVTDAGLATLQDFAKLGELGLAKLPITDDGLAKLSKLERLNSLTLRDCSKLTRKGVDELHQSKPAIRMTVQVDGRHIGTLHHTFVKWDEPRTATSNDK